MKKVLTTSDTFAMVRQTGFVPKKLNRKLGRTDK